jgi:Fimbrial protein.
MKKLIMMAPAALVSFATLPALATCSLLNGAAAGNITLSIPNQSLNPGTTAGLQLQTVTSSSAVASGAMGVTASTVFVKCTANESLQMVAGSYAPIAGTSPQSTGFLKTGIDNLYLFLRYSPGTATGILFPTTSGGTYSRSVSTVNTGAPRWADIGTLNVYLYQNGRVSKGGVVPAGVLTKWQTSDGVPLLNINLNSFTVNVKACVVTNPSINVSMGTINRSHFSGVSSTTGGNDFNVNMNCDSVISPQLTFDSPQQSSTANYFPLNNASDTTTAKGVGIQIYRGSAVVQPGLPVSLGTSVEGVNNYAFSAKYIQTASAVTAGKADGTVNFTLTYN